MYFKVTHESVHKWKQVNTSDYNQNASEHNWTKVELSEHE